MRTARVSGGAWTLWTQLRISAPQPFQLQRADPGLILHRDEAEAEKWFRLGAMGGDKTAVATMAHRYANGRGLIQSVSTALEWNQLAAEHGGKKDPRSATSPSTSVVLSRTHGRSRDFSVLAAAVYMARATADGRGTEPDAEQADMWRRQAAAGGDVDSCQILVVRHPADVLVSTWRLVLAEHGDVESQYYLGWCHEHGTDSVPQSLSEAVKWYELAADQGEGRATERCLAIAEAMELDPLMTDTGLGAVPVSF